MHREERLTTLSAALTRQGVLRLREAAELLDVSEMTVRRDIARSGDRFAYLGGHILHASDAAGGSVYRLEQEMDSHAAAKSAACANAVRLIQADDTIFIDCGTTLVHLAEMIPAHLPITALCYSLNVANILARKSNVRMMLLGGLFSPASATFTGEEGLGILDRVGINKAFFSAGGIDPARGVSCSNFNEVAVKKKVIARAVESHLVVDSSKFGKVKPAYFAEIGSFTSIITEKDRTATIAHGG